ncbi:hypothetical protein RQP46_010007 [Phenoliferia psychrophenolica]
MPAPEPVLQLSALLSDINQLRTTPGLLPSTTVPFQRMPPADLPDAAPKSAEDAVALAEEFLAQSDDVCERAEGVEALFLRIVEVERDATSIKAGLK